MKLLEALRSSASPTQGSGPQFYTPPESSQVSAGYNDLLENEVMAAATACNRKECARLISLFIDRLGEQGVRGYERQFYVQRLVSRAADGSRNRRPFGQQDSG